MYTELCFDYNYVFKIVSLYFTIIIYFECLCISSQSYALIIIMIIIISGYLFYHHINNYINCMPLIAKFENKDNIYQDILSALYFSKFSEIKIQITNWNS